MTKEKAQHTRRNLGEGGTKKIHVDIPEAVHQRVRVKAALDDVSMQVEDLSAVGLAKEEEPRWVWHR